MAEAKQARDIAAKLRLTAAALGCAGQKELCAAFRRANPKTAFDLDRSYKWVQGRSLPRSPQIYEDWAAVLGLDRPGAWVASSALDAFAEAVSARHGVDREALLRRAGLAGGDGGAPGAAGEDYLCGVYACYSHAQSPYYRGRVIRGALAIEPAPRRAEGLVATYSQALSIGRAHATGPVLASGRALSLALTAASHGAAPLFLNLVPPAPPASVLAGIMGGFTMVDPDGQPPYATRIAMVRVPLSAAALEASNRYMDTARDGPPSRDLAALGLRVADAAGLDARLGRFLNPDRAAPGGSDQVSSADCAALAAACDRAWLDTLAGRGAPPHARPADDRPTAGAPEEPGVMPFPAAAYGGARRSGAD